jgi:hypothetical protein
VTWPTKDDFVDGDVLTAAQVNNIADNLNLYDPTSATNGQVPIANGSGSVAFGTISADAWTVIASGSLSGSSVISMTSIPQTYKNLHLMVVNWGQATGSRLYPLFNNAQTSNFATTIRYYAVNGTAAGDDNQTLTGFPNITYPSTSNGSTGNFAYLMIPEYAKTTERSCPFTYIVAQSSIGSGSAKVLGRGTLATSGYTTAISSLDLYSSQTFNAGNYYLYGEK